ncbi:hypothetical protein F53441_11741 [Fusarium austroafricanum]|uniref:Uncharacterized protein n=1 Tax=Fusarium austroafricanum TaxID=2364996 RepID=A0A8H4NP59_9HYPO|nr:hypothetical protein F53441_11741 [Fusarium austroafricanum]
MADPNESSHFLLQPLNFNTPTPPPAGTGKTGYHVYQVDNSQGKHDKATSATSGNHGHDGATSATRSWYDEDGANQNTENTGLLIREIRHDDKHDLPKKQSRNIFLAWSLELALLLVATGLLGSILAVLGAYNTNEMPDWNGGTGIGITLNALIAIIATIYRTILAFVALEVLAQLKWDWITTTFRPVGDMQRFDDASRGAWGSLMLLPIVFKRQPQAILAVVVVVVSLAIGPFTQQTIQPHYCAKIAPEQSATISLANRVDGSLHYNERPSANKLHVGLEAAIQDAVVNPSQSSNIEALFNCPSGNCTFQAYPDRQGQPDQEHVSHASLGMCNRCEDISKLVKIKIAEPIYGVAQAIVSLPVPTRGNSSQRLEIISGIPSQGPRYLDATVVDDLAYLGEAVPKDFLNTARWSIANWTMLAFSQQNYKNGNVSYPLTSEKYTDPAAWYESTGYIAATCALYPCIKHYAGIVRAGALSERVIKSTPLVPQSNNVSVPQFYQGVQSPCFVNDTLYTSTNMTTGSEKLPKSARQFISVLPKNWEDQKPGRLIYYENVTAPNECIMELPVTFENAFQRSLQENFIASCRPQGFQAEFTSCFTLRDKSSLPMVSILRARTTSIKTIRENFDSMAMRITTEMRRAGLGAYGNSSARVKGDVLENRSCLRVAWEWMVLPAVLLLMCMVSAGWLIMKDILSKGNGVVWKSSILPLLLKNEVTAPEMMNLKELDEAGKKLEIKLEK